MPYIILIAGMPAAGKSTFCEYIQKKMKISAISKDVIKECLFDTIGFTGRAEKVRLSDASREIIFSLVENQMKLDLPIIIEDNFEAHTKSRWEEIIQAYGYKAITVLFEGELKAIYDRFVERNHGPNRHLGHVTNECYPIKDLSKIPPDMSYEAFCDTVINRGMRDFHIGEVVIRVDTTDLAKVDYEAVYNKICNEIK